MKPTSRPHKAPRSSGERKEADGNGVESRYWRARMNAIDMRPAARPHGMPSRMSMDMAGRAPRCGERRRGAIFGLLKDDRPERAREACEA